jgi:hypothetical protein
MFSAGVTCWLIVLLGGLGRQVSGALVWSCVVVELLFVGLILFVFVSLFRFPYNKNYGKAFSALLKKVEHPY